MTNLRRSFNITAAVCLTLAALLTVPEAVCAADPPVTMVDDAFNPQQLTAAAGSTVVWTNAGQRPHTVTTDNAGGPNSGTIGPGQTYEWSVPAGAASGTRYYYHCRFHAAAGDGKKMGPGMSGVVIVK